MTTAFRWGAFQLDAFQIDAEIASSCPDGQNYVDAGYVLDGYVCGIVNPATSTQPQGGAVSRSNKPRKRVVVEVDGKEYVVPIEGLQAFLDEIKNQAKLVEQPAPKRKKRTKKVVDTKITDQPVVKVVSAPPEEIALIQRHIDRTNEIMRQVWESALQRYIEDIEEEEWLLMLL